MTIPVPVGETAMAIRETTKPSGVLPGHYDWHLSLFFDHLFFGRKENICFEHLRRYYHGFDLLNMHYEERLTVYMNVASGYIDLYFRMSDCFPKLNKRPTRLRASSTASSTP